MSSLKQTVDRLKTLEAEKINLLAQVEDLKKIAEAKANSLESEIAALREEVSSLHSLVGTDKTQPSPSIEKNFAVQASAEKFLIEADRIGNQVFTEPPFSQNFDIWLGEARKIVSDFEASYGNVVDEQFRTDCSQVFLNLESILTKQKAEEANANQNSETLSENNRLLNEITNEYTEKEQALTLKRDEETQRLTKHIQELESEIEKQEKDNGKRKLLKKKTDDKLPQARQDLKATQKELESIQQNFAGEKEKLRSTYEVRKQEYTSQIEHLNKELGGLKIDSSLADRQEAAKALTNAANALVQRASSDAHT
ncbi:MAG: hypothetical protein ACQCN6_01965 [Candidatus Bathyarchaeia archaeon]|jgi:chromosome segregation ATPase